MYSLSTSFWMVPVSCVPAMPCCSATSWYISSSVAAGALIVIEVLTLSSGNPANRVRMSSRESIATPTLPTSPSGDRLVGVIAHLGGQVEGH
jgi:hypothetical protein